MPRFRLLSIAILMCTMALFAGRMTSQTASPVGIFESHQDVGTVLHPGSVEYDATSQRYTIAGSGENMWLGADAFQFAWKKMSGDVSLTADISFLTKTGNEHKKAVLMLRQSLDADSVYADVALHASGLTSLQFRDSKGALTREVQANSSAPKRVRIVKRGDYVYMALSNEGVDPHVAGGWLRIPLQGDFYVGLGVCSHDKDVVEKAAFSNVALTQPSAATGKPVLYSALETVEVDSADRRIVYLSEGRFEAPNWTRDGKAFLFNRDGRIESLPVDGGKPTVIDTGFANRCNNDHGISPDSKQLAISDNSQGDHESRVYLVPIKGGTSTPHDGEVSLVLAWLVAGRKDAGIRRAARRRIRHLYDSGGGWRRDAADDGEGVGRRAGIFSGREVYLLQLRTHRPHADLAHECRWQRPAAGFLR